MLSSLCNLLTSFTIKHLSSLSDCLHTLLMDLSSRYQFCSAWENNQNSTSIKWKIGWSAGTCSKRYGDFQPFDIHTHFHADKTHKHAGIAQGLLIHCSVTVLRSFFYIQWINKEVQGQMQLLYPQWGLSRRICSVHFLKMYRAHPDQLFHNQGTRETT